jgi:hypothetical protein
MDAALILRLREMCTEEDSYYYKRHFPKDSLPHDVFSSQFAVTFCVQWQTQPAASLPGPAVTAGGRRSSIAIIAWAGVP